MEECPLMKIDSVMPTGGISLVTTKINSMISENYYNLAIMSVVIVILLALLGYFIYSLVVALMEYKAFNKATASGTIDSSVDNEVYGVRSRVDPSLYMPKPKRTFLDELEALNTSTANQQQQQTGDAAKIPFTPHDNNDYTKPDN